MIKNETDRYPSWQSSFLAFNQHPFIQHMYVLSFALIGVSLLYLVAAQFLWFDAWFKPCSYWTGVSNRGG